jgi:hypothetical protein
MIDPLNGELERRTDIVSFQIRQFSKDFGVAQASRKQVQDIDHANPQAPDARPAAELSGV